MRTEEEKSNPKFLNTYKKLRDVQIYTKIKAVLPEKHKTVYQSGNAMQTDDLYGETIVTRERKELEGFVDEQPYPDKKSSKMMKGLRTYDGVFYSFNSLRDIEIIE